MSRLQDEVDDAFLTADERKAKILAAKKAGRRGKYDQHDLDGDGKVSE